MIDFEQRKKDILKDLIEKGYIPNPATIEHKIGDIVFEDSILHRTSFKEDAELIRNNFLSENTHKKPLNLSKTKLSKLNVRFILYKDKEWNNPEHGNLVVALLDLYDFVGMDLDGELFFGFIKKRNTTSKEREPIPERIESKKIENDDILIDIHGREYRQITLF